MTGAPGAGIIRIRFSGYHLRPDAPLKPEERQWIEEAIVSSLAGPLAERRFQLASALRCNLCGSEACDRLDECLIRAAKEAREGCECGEIGCGTCDLWSFDAHPDLWLAPLAAFEPGQPRPEVVLGDPALEEYLKPLVLRAASLIDQPPTWAGIEALAGRLLEANELKENETFVTIAKALLGPDAARNAGDGEH